MKFNHIGEFSGIGGFELAAQWIGWQNILSCEINPFGRRVLDYYWPESYLHDDIKTLTYQKANEELTKRFGKNWRGDRLVLSGGFPCQPYSNAGKRKGKEDHRHLWPEMLRTIEFFQPDYVVGENVRGLTNWQGGMVFDEVQADLETLNYEVLPFLLPACAVNAPHRRDRIWFIAHAVHSGHRIIGKQDGETDGIQGQRGEAIHSGTPDGTTGQFEHERIATNPESERERPGQSRSDKTSGQQLEGAESWRYGNHNGESGIITNSAHNRYEPSGNTRERGSGFKNGNTFTFANANSKQRSKGGLYTPEPKETERHISTFNAPCYEKNTWNEFPTQPPLCNGNDGFPSRLDGITFSKWRNESIKGGGNAIVPQVAYQIFKAIEQYENI